MHLAQLRTYLGRHFPAYASHTLEIIDRGWDFAVFSLDDTRVLRVPLHAQAAVALTTEVAVIDAVQAAAAPVHVPRCHFRWAGDALRPTAFAVMDRLAGESATVAAPRLGETFVLDVAAFLRRLHGVSRSELPAPMGDPTIAWLQRWSAGLDDVRASVFAELDPELRGAVEAKVAELVRALGDDEPVECLLHADLTSENLLVDAAGGLTAVLDWADATVGDPAFDLRTLARFVPSAALDTLAAAYDPNHHRALLRRARLYADLLPLEDAAWGMQSGALSLVNDALLELRGRLG